MYLNTFAPSGEPLDMTATDEFRSLLASAGDLGIPHDPSVPYYSRQIVLRRLRFHFLEWGRPDAPAIVLLHGGHQSAHSWDLVSLHLAAKYHVFALDQRGHGDSEWARDVEYGNHVMAQDAEAFIRAIGVDRPVLVGHSMGARNSMLLAKNDHSYLRAMVIVDVGPEVSERGRAAIMGFVQANQEFDDMDHFVENVRKYDPYRSREHIERTVKYNLLQRADPQESLTLDDVAKFDLPTMIVRGENSNILEPDAAERFAARLPNGRLVTVPNCGHNVHGQNTKGFLEVLDAYLEGLG